MLNLDTHMILFALDENVRPRERAILEADHWSISAAVIWEIVKLTKLGRIDRGLDDPLLISILARIVIWPISRDVAAATARLDFRSDPIDELIAATSIVHSAPLVTRDGKIRASKVVPLAR